MSQRPDALGRNLTHEIAKKSKDLRDDLSDAVVRGAKEVERYATNAKTGQ